MLSILSRAQFAFTVAFHFLFVPLTIGLVVMMCVFEYLHYKKNDDSYRKLTDFFGNIFIANYAVGIVTGIGMSLQLGTNWSKYLTFMGDVFGGPLALEALLAFFLESTFTGIFIFKRDKMSPKFRFVTVLLIALGTTISALWIITANAFMQNPVGYELSPDKTKIILTSFVQLVTNPYAWYMLVHTLTSAYLLGSMFVIAIISMKLLEKKSSDSEITTYKKGIKIASVSFVIFSVLMPIVGMMYKAYIAPIQPSKIDSISGASASVRGQVLHYMFLAMVVLGVFFIILSIYTLIKNKGFVNNTKLQKIFKCTWFLPYVGITLGWFVAETGRQPWVVNGLMKTEDGMSPVPVSQVWFSLITVILVNVILMGVMIYLSKIQVKKSIEDNVYSYNKKGGK